MKSTIAVLYTGGHTHHEILLIDMCLAKYPELCTITMEEDNWCPDCFIFQEDFPSFDPSTGCGNPQYHLHIMTLACNSAALC